MTKLKICGFTNLLDLEFAIKQDVNFLGINFVKKSPRYIDFSNFAEIYEKLKFNLSSSKLVAVVSNPSIEFVEKIVNSKMFPIIQFHGQENLEFISNFKGKIEIWKAVICDPQRSDLELTQEIESYSKVVDRFVLDVVKKADLSGGTEIFSRENLFKNILTKFNLVLAGGLNSENIDYFLQTLQPEIVDIASGSEISPRVKDYNKIKILKSKILAYDHSR